MPFVQRNGSGEIIGAFRNLQPGLAEEELTQSEIDAERVLLYVVPVREKAENLRTGLLASQFFEKIITAAKADPVVAVDLHLFLTALFSTDDFVLMRRFFVAMRQTINNNANPDQLTAQDMQAFRAILNASGISDGEFGV